MEKYMKCFIPTCGNDSKNSTKTIVRIREDLREEWCRQANVDYFQCYTQYCCEDHFDPGQDLSNFYFKSAKQEPRFKPTAKLRNIRVHLQEEGSTGLQEDESELAKLLLYSEPRSKKRRYQEANKPSNTGVISTPPSKVQVAVQAAAIMVDKSTNTNFKTTKLSSMPPEIHSPQPSSSAAVSDSQSLFSYPSKSESEGPITLIARKEFNVRKNNLEKIYNRPKMYLGIPKQFCTWLIDLIIKKSSSKINALCIVVTLLKMKQNDTIVRISDEFEISRTKLSTMILNGFIALGSFFQNFIVSSQPMIIKRNLPLVFKIRYSNVQIIIDCFEIQISKPSHTKRQAQTWSQYKHCNTVKYLVGCTPDGLISFISGGWGGRISDQAIVELSNLLDILHPNAVVLADRGFKQIECLLNSRGIKLLRPPSVFSGVKPTAEDVKKSKVIASLRIHVERVIRRIREFSILKPHSVVHYKYAPYLDEIVKIACGIINLQDELIKSC